MANCKGIPLTDRLRAEIVVRRNNRGWSQLTLAGKIGVTNQNTICAIELGRTNPTLDTLGKIARVLKIKVTPLQPADLGE